MTLYSLKGFKVTFIVIKVFIFSLINLYLRRYARTIIIVGRSPLTK